MKIASHLLAACAGSALTLSAVKLLPPSPAVEEAPIPVTAGSASDPGRAWKTTNGDVLRLLENTRLDRLVLEDASLRDAIEYVRRKVRPEDLPADGRPHDGVDFIVRLSHTSLLGKGSLTMENASALEVLLRIGETYGVGVRIEKRSVVFE